MKYSLEFDSGFPGHAAAMGPLGPGHDNQVATLSEARSAAREYFGRSWVGEHASVWVYRSADFDGVSYGDYAQVAVYERGPRGGLVSLDF